MSFFWLGDYFLYLFFPLHRQNSVEDLMKLARQFDENMQQDAKISEQFNTLNNNPNNSTNTSQTKLTETSFHSSVKDPKCPSSSDQMEAELHALFDCSTQKVSGRLSQGSLASACSQERNQSRTSNLAGPQQAVLKPVDKSGSAAHSAEEKGSHSVSTNNCEDFDDDWENDDLLNDSFVLAMTQNPDQKLDTKPKTALQNNTKTNTTQFTSVCRPTANSNSAHQLSNLHSKLNCSLLQELCPIPKTTNRSTFKLEPNPYFQPKTAAREVPMSSFTVMQPKLEMSDKEFPTTKTLSTPQPDKITNDQEGDCVAADSVKDISDSLWDDGEDDALLYQVCDSVERISNSQPQHISPSNWQQKRDVAGDRQQKTTAPLPIDTTWTMNAGASANRQSPRAFVRSNSLPATSCETLRYPGWNVPMKGANNKSQMSQSLPGSHVSLGAFSQCKDMKPHTVTARLPQNFNSHHTAFKRNVSDSAAISNKGK